MYGHCPTRRRSCKGGDIQFGIQASVYLVYQAEMIRDPEGCERGR